MSSSTNSTTNSCESSGKNVIVTKLLFDENVYIPFRLYVLSMKKLFSFVIADFIDYAIEKYVNDIEYNREQILQRYVFKLSNQVYMHYNAYRKLNEYSNKYKLTMSQILNYVIERALHDKCWKLVVAENIIKSLGYQAPDLTFPFHLVIEVLKNDYREFNPYRLFYILQRYGIISCIDRKCSWITINHIQLMRECYENQRTKIKIVKPY